MFNSDEGMEIVDPENPKTLPVALHLGMMSFDGKSSKKPAPENDTVLELMEEYAQDGFLTKVNEETRTPNSSRTFQTYFSQNSVYAMRFSLVSYTWWSVSSLGGLMPACFCSYLQHFCIEPCILSR